MYMLISKSGLIVVMILYKVVENKQHYENSNIQSILFCFKFLNCLIIDLNT